MNKLPPLSQHMFMTAVTAISPGELLNSYWCKDAVTLLVEIVLQRNIMKQLIDLCCARRYMLMFCGRGANSDDVQQAWVLCKLRKIQNKGF